MPMVSTVLCLSLLLAPVCSHRTGRGAGNIKVEGHLDGAAFPEDLGPYYLFDAGFHIDASLEFRLTPDGLGWIAGDASGELSPRVDVHLPDQAVALGLPEDAIHGVAWAYPDKKYAEDPAESAQSLFKKMGGYVYYGNCAQVVAVRGVVPAARVMKLGIPQECPSCNLEECPGNSGFMQYPEVTVPALRSSFTHFCWLPPDSCSKVSYHQDGCFAYKKKDAFGFLIYPVSTEQAQGGFPNALGPFVLASLEGPRPPLTQSQWTPLTIPALIRSHATIPTNATSFTWAYPLRNSELAHGGFVYGPDEVVKRVVPTDDKVSFGLASNGDTLNVEVCAIWHDVVSKSDVPGARRYCWSMENGGGSETFHYEMEDGSIVSYTVA